MSLTHDHMKEMTLKQHRKLVARRKKQMVKEQNRQQRISSKLKQASSFLTFGIFI